jgi:hypothetical protein
MDRAATATALVEQFRAVFSAGHLEGESSLLTKVRSAGGKTLRAILIADSLSRIISIADRQQPSF